MAFVRNIARGILMLVFFPAAFAAILGPLLAVPAILIGFAYQPFFVLGLMLIVIGFMGVGAMQAMDKLSHVFPGGLDFEDIGLPRKESSFTKAVAVVGIGVAVSSLYYVTHH